MRDVRPVVLPPRNGLQDRIVYIAAAHNRLVRFILFERSSECKSVIVILRMLIGHNFPPPLMVCPERRASMQWMAA